MAKKKVKKIDEISELDQTYTALTGRDPNAKKKKPSLVAICIVAAVLLLCAAAAGIICFGSWFDSYLTMGNVTIAGVDVSGMTKQQAKEAVLIAIDGTYTQTPMEVQVLDTIVTLRPEDTAIAPNMNAAVNAAFRRRASGVFDLYPYLNMDEAVIQQALDTLTTAFNSNLQQTVYAVEGEKPENEANTTGMWLKITLGVPGYGLDAQELYEQVRAAYNGNTFHAEASCTVVEPEQPDLQALFDQHCTAPIDAVMDPKTFDVTPDVSGYGFNMEQAATALAGASYGETLTLPFQTLEASVTEEALAATLFCDVLGSCKTPYSGSDNNSRNTNLRLACEAIDGVVIYPGETFTYNHTLGERTAERGYKPAPSYDQNGRTVDTYGGGICQVSTNLYYCTLLADLEIVERWHHGYVPAYITWGMDASVSWNSGDFRFKNNTNYPIRIEAYRADGNVFVQLLGTDEKDYYVKMESVTLSTKKYETVYEEHSPDNKYGYQDGQELVSPYTGYKVNAYKCKYSKETDELISRELESVNNYSKRDRLLVKIVDPNATTPTETP